MQCKITLQLNIHHAFLANSMTSDSAPQSTEKTEGAEIT